MVARDAGIREGVPVRSSAGTPPVANYARAAATWLAGAGRRGYLAADSVAAICSIVVRAVSGKLISRPFSWPATASSIR